MTVCEIELDDMEEIYARMLAPGDADWQARFCNVLIMNGPSELLPQDVLKRRERGRIAGTVLAEYLRRRQMNNPKDQWKAVVDEACGLRSPLKKSQSWFDKYVWAKYAGAAHFWAAETYLPFEKFPRPAARGWADHALLFISLAHQIGGRARGRGRGGGPRMPADIFRDVYDRFGLVQRDLARADQLIIHGGPIT